MKPNVIVAPTDLPVAYSLLVAHIRPANPSAERALIMQYAAAATERAERLLEMALMPRTLEVTFDKCDRLRLPIGPIYDGSDAYPMTIIDADGDDIAFTLKHVGHWINFELEGSATYPLTVTYSAGFATIPADFVDAILIDAATRYAWRENKSAAAASDVHRLDDWYRYRSANPGVF